MILGTLCSKIRVETNAGSLRVEFHLKKSWLQNDGFMKIGLHLEIFINMLLPNLGVRKTTTCL